MRSRSHAGCAGTSRVDLAAVDHKRPVHQIRPLGRPQGGADIDGRTRILEGCQEGLAFLSKAVDQGVCRLAGRKTLNPVDPARFSCHIASESKTRQDCIISMALVKRAYGRASSLAGDGGEARPSAQRDVACGSCSGGRSAMRHSITASAPARKFSGNVRPMAFAAARLTTNSDPVACSTGNSRGLAPLRILSA